MKLTVREMHALYGDDAGIVEQAKKILERKLRSPGHAMANPALAKDFLRMHFAGIEAEHFVVLFLDVKNRLIEAETMFTGTLTSTSVYPREVVKRALYHNAACVMLAHNHPSGEPEPSQADHLLTRTLQQALALVDIRILDHFIVAGVQVHSFAEHGQI